MLAHVPVFSHPAPKTALVVGGGDGGIIRELCRHSTLESIVMVELDEGVPAASKEFFGASLLYRTSSAVHLARCLQACCATESEVRRHWPLDSRSPFLCITCVLFT